MVQVQNERLDWADNRHPSFLPGIRLMISHVIPYGHLAPGAEH